MNRVTAQAAKVRSVIAAGGKNGALDTPAKVAAFEAAQAIDFSEHVAFQNTQSKAFACGILTLDEAQTVYASLGEVGSQDNGGWADGTDLATKVTVTKLMGELLGAAVRA